jgi:DNA replication ATP-dependent helicase Dna2
VAPIVLPDLIHDDYACKKCYSNRECSTYDATVKLSTNEPPSELGAAFTSHLGKEELEYFLKWDKLIDFEVDAEGSSIARAWLVGPDELDTPMSPAASALAFDVENSTPVINLDERCGRQDVAYFSRTKTGSTSSHRDSLSIGTRVVVSMDTTTLQLASKKTWKSVHRPQMHIARGDVYESSLHRVGLRVSQDDLLRLHKVASRSLPVQLLFRMDRDSGAAGVGTLKQNLINLLTGDKKTNSEPGTTVEGSRLPRLRDLLLKLQPPTYDDDWKSDLMFKQSATNPVANQIPSCNLAFLEKEFQTLNMDQQSAVRKVFVAKDYTLIQGLPGTGTSGTMERSSF